MSARPRHADAHPGRTRGPAHAVRIAHGGYPVATDDGGFVCDFPCGNDWTKLCTDPPCPPGATSAVPGAECNTKCLDYISPRCGVGRKPICDSQVDADRFLSLAARCL